MFLELEGIVSTTGLIETQGGDQVIVAMLDQLSFAAIAITIFCIVSITRSATTYDSSSYSSVAAATMFLKDGDDPTRWHRVFRAFASGLLPVTLMFIGGLIVLQTTPLVVSLSILLAGMVMSFALVKTLVTDSAHKSA